MTALESEHGYPIKYYIIYTYLLFWFIFIVTGAVIYLKAPQLIQNILKYACAWTSTFVFLLLFKKIFPHFTFFEYLKNQFPKVNIIDFVVPMIIQLSIIILAVITVLYLEGRTVKEIEIVKFSRILQLFVLNIIYGPMGEEIGWRSYALNELQKKYSPLVASLIIGSLWGLWHFPLWFLSGYGIFDGLAYCFFFMLGIISLSVFMTIFYNQSKSILIAIWIHFLFNYLLQVALIDSYELVKYTSIFYFVAIVLLVILNKEKMLKRETIRNQTIASTR